MTSYALLVGGIVPTFMLGVSTFMMKIGMRAGGGIYSHLVLVGVTVATVGALGIFHVGAWQGGAPAAVASVSMGLAWSLAIGCIAYGMSELRLPASVVGPLTNANALVVVVLSAVFLSEWREISVARVATGAVLIVLGSGLVATGQHH